MTDLKSLHGWRLFAGEVGVIVLGVLIALGAQQLMETWQVRQDVRAFRETIDREIGFTLYTQDVRYVQLDCDLRRVAEVREWLDKSRSGAPMPPIYPRGALGSAPYRGAWNSRDADTYRQLPAEVRQKYAMFYDGDDNLQVSRMAQNGDWRDLGRFAEPGPVTLEERRTSRPILDSLRHRIDLDRPNIDAERQIAKELGIKSIIPQDLGEDFIRQARECHSTHEPPQP
ncbi:MAG: hypothetical protein ABIT69_01080 [Sphingomicrobium sp.]